MPEPNEISGLPDHTWSANQIAEYEALKAKWLAERSDEPEWLNEPLYPIDDVIEELERLHAELESGGGKS
jgi:hypothetical protein